MWPLADQPEPRPHHGSATRLLRLTRPAFRRRSADRIITEPPDTDPYVRWCGRGGVVRLPPIPIRNIDSCRRPCAVRESGCDAVDGSSTGTEVPSKWALLMLP